MLDRGTGAAAPAPARASLRAGATLRHSARMAASAARPDRVRAASAAAAGPADSPSYRPKGGTDLIPGGSLWLTKGADINASARPCEPLPRLPLVIDERPRDRPRQHDREPASSQ